jgi:hypothetical protein
MHPALTPLSVQDPAAAFLPTVERARSAGALLPSEPPVETHRLAALVVLAALLRRETWDEETELADEVIETIQTGVPPIPEGFTGQCDRRIAEVLQTQECSACLATPGFRTCRICQGTGQMYGGRMCSCANGYVPCPTCLGKVQSKYARIRYYHDRPAFLRETYVPTVITCIPALFSFERAFEELAPSDMDPPECLRCHDLTTRKGGTAYRGGEREVVPDFYGHLFGDTIEKAVSGLSAAGVGKTAVRSDIRAFAWPLLWLRYDGGRERVLFMKRSGEIHTFEGT